MSQQQQRQISLSDIYSIIGQKDVELRLASAQYEAALAAQAQRIHELEAQVAKLTTPAIESAVTDTPATEG